ncbi:MAG: TSUP family transporter [Thermoleophilaceae bacterium]
MSAGDVVGAVAIGFAAGMSSGLVGVGGGILFVPGLVLFLGASQLDAEATSLLAIVAVAAVGAWRQSGYGNVRLREGLVIGALSPLGVAAGTVLSNAVPERALELGFAAVQLFFAWRLARRAIWPPDSAAHA